MARALLALGSNLGRPAENLDRAVQEISFSQKTFLVARSGWHSTEPVGGPAGQGDFLNASVLVETGLQPMELSEAMHNLESRMGRERRVRWDARLIDIDLLLYDQQTIALDSLTVPHPRMSFRRFVLEPASEIAGALIHPASGWTLGQLNRHLQQSELMVAIVASDPQLTESLVSSLRNQWGEQLSHAASTNQARCKSPLILTTWPPERGNSNSEPGLVIAWDCNSPGQLEDECLVRDKISWNGPLAMVGGEHAEDVVAEAVAAIQAAWPEWALATPSP